MLWKYAGRQAGSWLFTSIVTKIKIMVSGLYRFSETLTDKVLENQVLEPLSPLSGSYPPEVVENRLNDWKCTKTA